MHRDPDKQWLTMAYKIIDAELEFIVQDWPVDWRKPVTAEDISIGTLVDSLDEKVHAR